MSKDSTAWMATVSSHCRRLIETAGLAIRDKEEYEVKARQESLRTTLAAHKDALQALLPEDFPKSRISDLARHIHFCDPNDWHDIVFFDVPDILTKAERYAMEMPDDGIGELEEFIHARFRPRLDLALRSDNPDFHDLVLTCCVDLATLFKRKSGSADDSDGEIGRILNPNNSVLLVSGKLDTETDRNRQRGAMLLMQGWRSFLRNPHVHEVRPTDKEYAIHSLMLMSFLARIIDGATSVEIDVT